MRLYEFTERVVDSIITEARAAVTVNPREFGMSANGMSANLNQAPPSAEVYDFNQIKKQLSDLA